MSASYPSAVKTFTTKATGDKIQASHINDLQDEVHAIETDLLTGGITPTISDSDDSNVLTLATTSNLTADRTLTFVPGDASRTITLSGNPTLNDWFNQSVKSTASPQFASIGVGVSPSVDAGLQISPTLTGTTNAFGILMAPSLTVPANGAGEIARLSGTLVEAASGTHALLAGLRVSAPTITAGDATVTEAATVYVGGAPTATATTVAALHVASGATLLGGALTVTGAATLNGTVACASGVSEHSRAFNAGDTQTPTFSAGNYTMDSGTWTVASGDVRGFSYRLIGDTCFLSLALDATSVSGTPGAELRVTLPVTAAEAMTAPAVCFDNTTNRNAIATVTSSSTRLTIKRADGANWTASTNATSVFVTMAFKVS